MTKRDAPDSGFDTTKSPKKQSPNPTSAVHSTVANQSLQPAIPAPTASHLPLHSSSSTIDHPPSPANVSNTPAIQNATPSSPSHAPSDHQLFLPQSQPEDSVKDHEEFVPSENQRNEILVELAHLQAAPVDTVDEVSSVPDSDDQQHNDDQQNENPTAQPSSARKKKRNKKKLHEKQVRKAYMDPLFWPEGLPDSEAIHIARQSDSLVCGTTGISLDTEPLLVNGTVWKEILVDELPEVLRDNDKIPFLPEQDTFDFLKACMRLGSLVEPHQLSRLLGEGYRSPEYCSFLLQGFLGLLYSRKVRNVLQGHSPEHPPEGHTDVVVNADQLYPSDDELIRDQEASMANFHEENIPVVAANKVAIVEESDREEDEGHKDPVHVENSGVHEFKYTNRADHRFLEVPSYVQRNYMSVVSGREIKDIDEFASYLRERGATFLEEPEHEPLKRLKWLKEKMPAPNMGREAAVSEPLLLWKQAIKTYSRRNLARCALIKTNSLLDWLGYVANETTVATSEKEFFEDKQPVVAVAPVPTLHLADKAMDFVLRVLTVAVQTEELSSSGAEENTDHILIDEDDVTNAAHELADDPDMKRGVFMSGFTNVLGNDETCNDEWPSLLQRPMTGCETMTLCDRSPKALISVPTAIMEEMRSVVMSFRQVVTSRIYAKPRLMKAKDPLVFMSNAERSASGDRRRQYNQAYGISWGKPTEGKSGGEKESKSDEHIGSRPKHGEEHVSQARKFTGQDENVKDVLPSSGQEKPTTLTPRPASTVTPNAKLPDFFDQVNFAELTAFRLGNDEIQKRKEARNKTPVEDLSEISDDAAVLLKENEDGSVRTTSTVCFHRLGWICLHALGVSLERSQGDMQPIGFGSLANYTNFGQFRGGKPVIMTGRALFCLAKIADMIVRSEGEILMSCAAHDDGRPWIDRADVALVTSVRKDEFHYSDL